MSALASANPRNFGVKRIMKEYAEFERDAASGANDYFTAKPCEDNLFEWHFTIRGPPDSDFANGRYHGRILLPSEYPFKPPDIMMLTASGRFETHKKICLSISSFHPKNWQPSWSIRTVLTALIAFFPTPGNGAIGSLEYSPAERREYAARSGAATCELCGKSNLEMLPDLPAGAAERSGASAGPPALPADVLATIDQNKGIPALTGVSQPGTPAQGVSASSSHHPAPPTPLALSQGARIAALAASNPMSPMLLRTFSEPVKLAPGQAQAGVGEGSMTLPPPSEEKLSGAAAVTTPASSSSSAAAVAAAAAPAASVSSSATTPLLAPLVLDEGLRQRQGRVMLPNEQQPQMGAPAAVAAVPAPRAAAAAAVAAVAAPRAPVVAQQVRAGGGAPLSSVTVLLTLLILLILARKLYSSVHSKPSFGLDRDFLSD